MLGVYAVEGERCLRIYVGAYRVFRPCRIYLARCDILEIIRERHGDIPCRRGRSAQMNRYRTGDNGSIRCHAIPPQTDSFIVVVPGSPLTAGSISTDCIETVESNMGTFSRCVSTNPGRLTNILYVAQGAGPPVPCSVWESDLSGAGRRRLSSMPLESVCESYI